MAFPVQRELSVLPVRQPSQNVDVEISAGDNHDIEISTGRDGDGDSDARGDGLQTRREQGALPRYRPEVWETADSSVEEAPWTVQRGGSARGGISQGGGPLGPQHDYSTLNIVQTECGPVGGQQHGEVTRYSGIPYAAPPIGQRRWLPPTGGECWKGILDATKRAPACAQAEGYDDDVPPTEDCLTLDIYMPRCPGGASSCALPVLVFVHGGDLVSGSSSEYNMTTLALKGPSVVLCVNYRLSIFGWLALPELSARDPRGVSGNLGLLDVQAALRWVQRNIQAFSGASDKVLVFGQSSGGTIVTAMLASPASRGLFHAAASLSGSPKIAASLAAAEQYNEALKRSLQCEEPPVVDCLLAKSTSELLHRAGKHYKEGWQPTFSIPGKPSGLFQPPLCIVDGVTVLQEIGSALAQRVIDVPMLFQGMAQEADLRPHKVVFNMNNRRFKQLLNKRYSHKHWPRQSRDHGGLAKGIYDHFYRGDLGFNPQKAYDSINADTGVICGNIEIAKAAATAFRSPVYLVIIETAPSHAQDGDGDKKYGMRYAGHTWDLKAGTEDWDDYIPQSSDLRFSAILQRMWYTLARDERLPDEFFPMNHHGRRANLNVLGRRGVVGPRHWRDGVCAWWSHNGVGKEFWWQN